MKAYSDIAGGSVMALVAGPYCSDNTFFRALIA